MLINKSVQIINSSATVGDTVINDHIKSKSSK